MSAYYYCNTKMTDEDIAKSKEIAKAAGHGFAFSEVKPGRFCFWVENGYGGSASIRESEEVLHAIEAAGVSLPKE